MKYIFTVIVVFCTVFLSVNKISAHPAWGIVVDRQGQVYFSDLSTGQKRIDI